jgi:hypothetical protein
MQIGHDKKFFRWPVERAGRKGVQGFRAKIKLKRVHALFIAFL